MKSCGQYLRLWILIASVASAGAEEPTINPECWKITLPLPDSAGKALEIRNPQFAAYVADPTSIPAEQARYFWIEDGVYFFYCPSGAATTENSKYSRSELREMKGNSGADEYQWTLAEGGNLKMRFKIGPLVGGADKLIFAQIHGHRPDSKPLLKCIWEKGHLRLMIKSGDNLTDYQKKPRYLALAEGEWHTCKIVASANELSIAINDQVVETFEQSHLQFWPDKNTFYFKAGNYLQEKDEGCAATVSISHLSVKHDKVPAP